MQKISKKAIEAALRSNWEEAIELNLQILEKEPKNIDAKNRLGRAYLNINQNDKARDTFEDVLKIDPINQVAKKNLRILSNKSKNDANTSLEPVSLVKEPGTTVEINLKIAGSGMTADDLIPGEKFTFKKTSQCLDLYRTDSKRKLASIQNISIVKKINQALKDKADISIRYVKGKDKDVTFIIKSSLPVFKSQKQDIRPYVKKGAIEEPELEMAESEITDND